MPNHMSLHPDGHPPSSRYRHTERENRSIEVSKHLGIASEARRDDNQLVMNRVLPDNWCDNYGGYAESYVGFASKTRRGDLLPIEIIPTWMRSWRSLP